MNRHAKNFVKGVACGVMWNTAGLLKVASYPIIGVGMCFGAIGGAADALSELLNEDATKIFMGTCDCIPVNDETEKEAE